MVCPPRQFKSMPLAFKEVVPDKVKGKSEWELLNMSVSVEDVLKILATLTPEQIKDPNLKRPFKVGNTFIAWIVSIVLIATIIIALIATFAVGTLSNFIIVAIISIVLTVLPFWFVKIRKDSWSSEVKELMAKENIDGGLVGGASLVPDSYLQLVNYKN